MAGTVQAMTATLGFRLAGFPVSTLLVAFSFILDAFIFWTHRKNIARLRKGEEKRFEKLRLLPRLFKRRSE
jgi:glycerol-3-phosphate acyltransferase PlsY